MAVESVTIMQTSPYPDEYIAHRIGLMPFSPDDQKAETASVRMDVRNSGRALAKEFSGDAKPLTPNMIVATLPEECFIQLTCKLGIGCGKKHQRYNHVAAARVSRRSEGMDMSLDECWCRDTKPGTVCEDCAGTKHTNPHAPINHILSFETFGDKAPEEILRQALLVTRMKLNRIAIALKASPNWKDAPPST